MKKDVEKIQQFDKNDSTVFSDPKKSRENGEGKQKSKARIIRNVIIAIILVFVVLPWGIVTVAKWVKGPSTPVVIPFSSRLAATEADNKAKELFSLKNADINNQAANEEILQLLDISYDCGEYEVVLQTEQEPYRLTMSFKYAPDSSRAEWFETTMVKYSCMLLALTEDADEIGWEYPANDSKDTGGYFTREDARKFLGTDVSEYAKSAEGIQLLLNELGLND